MAREALCIPPKDCASEGILWYIYRHGLASGDRLPPERELCELLGVSRTALRSSIAAFISSGLLESRQGSGTYLRPPKPLNIFQETYSFSSSVRDVGLVPSSRLVYSRLGTCDEGLASKLEVDAGAPVFELRRVRMADGDPVSIETAYVNYALCPGIEGCDFEQGSLYDALFERYGLRVLHGNERISVTRLQDDEASLLKVPSGTPVFLEKAVERAEDLTPIEYCKALILPDRYRFADNGGADGERSKVDERWLKSWY